MVENRNMVGKIYTDVDGDYLKKNPTWHIEDSPWKAEQIIKIINRNSISPKTIAEVGCGAGEILNRLHQSMPNDVTFTGYDISIDAIRFAKQREKDRLLFKQENLIESDATFDLLLMIDVFEHVDDYMGFLRSCKNKAQYKIFHIPLDASVQMILRNKLISVRESVGHLHYFMKDTAIATLVDSGYEIIDSFYTAGMLDLPKKNFKSKIAYVPRKILYSLNKDFAAKTIGGFSLLVLAK